MFSLKLDLLFPSLDMAKATAKKFNAAIRRPAPPDIDPRELKRMRDELQAARNEVLLKVAMHRRLFL